jgi:hypothetical protein
VEKIRRVLRRYGLVLLAVAIAGFVGVVLEVSNRPIGMCDNPLRYLGSAIFLLLTIVGGLAIAGVGLILLLVLRPGNRTPAVAVILGGVALPAAYMVSGLTDVGPCVENPAPVLGRAGTMTLALDGPLTLRLDGAAICFSAEETGEWPAVSSDPRRPGWEVNEIFAEVTVEDPYGQPRVGLYLFPGYGQGAEYHGEARRGPGNNVHFEDAVPFPEWLEDPDSGWATPASGTVSWSCPTSPAP